MSDTKKSSSSPLIPILVVGALGFGIYKIVGKAKEVDNFLNNYNFTVKAKHFKLQLLKFQFSFKIDVTIINPSEFEAKFEKPTIIIEYKGQELARSTPSSTLITIAKKGNTTISDLDFSIGLTNSVFVQMARDFMGNNLSLTDISNLISKGSMNLANLMKNTTIRGLIYVKSPVNTSFTIPPTPVG